MDIQWHRGLSADAALRAHLLRGSRCELASLETATGRHCTACGSERHGRPWARLADGSRPHVSLARCGDVVVTAVDPLRPVGVDVEDITAVDARWDPTLVLAPGERADTPAERAATWCRKEAILKALGTGLRTPMSEIRCANWPVEDLAAPPGLAAAVVALPPGQTGSGGSSTA
ncbi:4'-phosphopantetheinyl transferase superfamily protein [Janibacter sp. CX7]|uniref:4'-phosphopantetheinyl transferase family protein n=1 Tax=Janibacter sp. CX7 TaxID=2963431 RepID=UPI0020CD91D4|nr:4'-phosphopantetheinyl transferase superfamily protein [Janibacter sp. CX7]UTT66846.1 4'-phosphopantetheinyl transferase superfamily protein [Janibacter sp. CX7]